MAQIHRHLSQHFADEGLPLFPWNQQHCRTWSQKMPLCLSVLFHHVSPCALDLKLQGSCIW